MDKSSKPVAPISLEALLLLGVGAARVNRLITWAQIHKVSSPAPSLIDDTERRQNLSDDFRASSETIEAKMPPFASKDMTWKTVYVTPNIAVGFEPDDEDDWDEHASENPDEVFSSDCADETDSDESTATVNVPNTTMSEKE